MDQHLELFAALAAPFAHDEVRVRPQGTRQIQYITARTVMNRLDEVLGPACWWDDYVPQENSVICRLTIRLPDGTTLTKSDAGGYAGMSDSGDDDKSGFSDAFKRAAVKFGIGRYLYRDGVPRFVHERHQDHDRTAAPDHARHEPAPQAGPAPAQSHRNGTDGHAVPQTGKALFAWIKHQEDVHGQGLLKRVSDWAERHEFPSRMLQWSAEQVQQAFAEAQTLSQATNGQAARPAVENGTPRVEPPRPTAEAAPGRPRRGR